MNFQKFQKTLAEAVRNQSEEGLDVRLQTVMKNNGIRRRAMEITGSRSGIYPSIYMEPYYSRYQSGVPVAQLADLVLEQCGSYRTQKQMPGDFFHRYQDARDRIYCKLINYEKNARQLTDIPHLRWKDLALVCYYIVEPEILPDASILIRSEHIRAWEIEECYLIQNAWEITRRNMKPVLRPMHEVLAEMSGAAPEDADNPLFVLTNEIRTYGAVLMADQKLLKKLAVRMKGDYYILPSSVHECLILPAEDTYQEEMLIRMIREINRTQVAPQEVLSDNLYVYHALQEELYVRDGLC